MRLGRHRDEAYEEDELVAQTGVEDDAKVVEEKEVDLTKLKKKDLLEIMLRQGEEIDALRAEVADLKAKLEDREFKIYKAGSLAEASLAVTKIFEEADQAARIYVENIRSKVK